MDSNKIWKIFDSILNIEVSYQSFVLNDCFLQFISVRIVWLNSALNIKKMFNNLHSKSPTKTALFLSATNHFLFLEYGLGGYYICLLLSLNFYNQPPGRLLSFPSGMLTSSIKSNQFLFAKSDSLSLKEILISQLSLIVCWFLQYKCQKTISFFLLL